MDSSNKIGFFGGTFDPIHFGHLNMAEGLLRAKDLDEVWFSPAYINPFKQTSFSQPINHRLSMVKLAIEPYSQFRLVDTEAKRSVPSYTIDIIRSLLEEKGKQKFYLMMSDEEVLSFFDWKEASEIVKLVPLLIGSRTGKMPDLRGKNPAIVEAIHEGWQPTPMLSISSTIIRQKLKENQDCSNDLPKKVLDYIYANHLYS